MNKCKKCGKQLREDTVICPFCAPRPAQDTGETKKTEIPDSWKKLGLTIAILIGAWLLLYAVNAWHNKTLRDQYTDEVKAMAADIRDPGKSIEVRIALAEKLKEHDHPLAQQALEEIKKDPSVDYAVRSAASTYEERNPSFGEERYPSTKDAVDAMMKRLDSENPAERSKAAVKLGYQMEHEQRTGGYDYDFNGGIAHVRPSPDHIDISYFIPPLIEATRDPFPEVRASALEALSKAGRDREAEILPVFLNLVNDPSYLVKCEVMRLLVHGGHEEIIDPMMNLLDDPDKRVRLEAIRGLGNMRVEQAIPKLTELLNDKDGQTVERAKDALRKISGEIKPDRYW